MYHSLLTSKSSCLSSLLPSVSLLKPLLTEVPHALSGGLGDGLFPLLRKSALCRFPWAGVTRDVSTQSDAALLPASMLCDNRISVCPQETPTTSFLQHQDNLPQLIMPLNSALVGYPLTLKPLSHPFLTLLFLIPFPEALPQCLLKIISKISTAFISSLNFSESLWSLEPTFPLGLCFPCRLSVVVFFPTSLVL